MFKLSYLITIYIYCVNFSFFSNCEGDQNNYLSTPSNNIVNHSIKKLSNVVKEKILNVESQSPKFRSVSVTPKIGLKIGINNDLELLNYLTLAKQSNSVKQNNGTTFIVNKYKTDESIKASLVTNTKPKLSPETTDKDAKKKEMTGLINKQPMEEINEYDVSIQNGDEKLGNEQEVEIKIKPNFLDSKDDLNLTNIKQIQPDNKDFNDEEENDLNNELIKKTKIEQVSNFNKKLIKDPVKTIIIPQPINQSKNEKLFLPSIFFVFSILVLLLCVLFYNKNKILALIVEGRIKRRTKVGRHGVNARYRRLNMNDDEEQRIYLN